ncbi:MAG TPA: hypothetical protein PL124_12810, partial [Candidatus Cloacimonadota bacterium]|nr:hypothetical protein [Candidatus Cloacimonadota bacterium]
KLYDRVRRNPDLTIPELTTHRQVSKYIRPIFRLMNESFVKIYGYSHLEEEEMNQLANRYLPIVHPRYIKLALHRSGDLAGFILAIPNVAEGLIKSRGRLLPLGILHILNARRRSTKLDTYIGAVKEEFRNRGVDTLLGYSMIETAIRDGFSILDGHHQLELNSKIRAEMENVNGYVAKRYRIYQKALG